MAGSRFAFAFDSVLRRGISIPALSHSYDMAWAMSQMPLSDSSRDSCTTRSVTRWLHGSNVRYRMPWRSAASLMMSRGIHLAICFRIV